MRKGEHLARHIKAVRKEFQAQPDPTKAYGFKEYVPPPSAVRDR